ncbi:uncharacterized protein LOC143184630 isoform X2 [Calliopsis andreniformis]
MMYAFSECYENKTMDLNSFKEMHASEKSFEKKQNHSLCKHRINDRLNKINKNKKLFSNVANQNFTKHCRCNKDNHKQHKIKSLNCSYAEDSRSTLKDKFNITIDNLIDKLITDRNCSQKCINKIVELFNYFLYYIISHISIEDNESQIDSKLDENNCIVEGRSNKINLCAQEYCAAAFTPLLNAIKYGRNTKDNIEMYCKNLYSIKMQRVLDKKITDCNNLLQKKNSISLIDSEHFLTHTTIQSEEENSITSRKSVQDKTNVSIDVQSKDDHKPKLLSRWVPRVICGSELGLIFEGNLLNEVGYAMERKFRTDMVLHRISPKLIETVNHEFYELVGELTDPQHVVPKELISQCRYGCPFRIKRFCNTWKLLQNFTKFNAHSTISIKNTNDSIDIVTIGVRSKGREIIPTRGKRKIVQQISELRYLNEDENVPMNKKQRVHESRRESHNSVSVTSKWCDEEAKTVNVNLIVSPTATINEM